MKMQQNSDEELVAKYKETQDHKYLTELFTRHSGVLYRCALRTTKNPSNAEDVLQTAFIKMITDLANYKGTGSVIGWMLQVVIHTCYERFRSEKSRLNRERKFMSERSQTTIPKNEELKEMIETHLNKLPEIYKVPITLKILEGLSIKEVSDALEIPEKTIRSQIDRGLEKLKVSLQSVGITASLISIGDMLQAIKKPLTPEVFTNNQYFTGLFQKKASLSAKIATTTGANFFGYQFLMAFLALIAASFVTIYLWNHTWKVTSLSSQTKRKQEWNFEKAANLAENLNLGLLSGSISIAESLGVDKSNALKIEESSILEIDISGFQLPIKISYQTDIYVEKLANEQGFMQMILKGNYRKDQKIIKISGLRDRFSIAESNRNSNAKLGYFGKWYAFIGYIDEKYIDFFMEGKRSYYLEGASHDNKKLFLLLKANTIIDNLKIESIDKSALPSKEKIESVCASINYLKDVEYYDLEKEKLGIPDKSNVKPYLRMIRTDFFSQMAGTDNEVIYPILNSKRHLEWVHNPPKIFKRWSFDKEKDLADFKTIKGKISTGKELGMDKSNCLLIEAESVFEIDISKFQLPLKISYSYDFLIPDAISGIKNSKGIVVLKGNYHETKNILNFVKFRPTRQVILNHLSKNENFEKGYTGEWNSTIIYVSENCIDLYFNGNRTALMMGTSKDNKKLYFEIKDKYLIENFIIESVGEELVPDYSSFKAFSETFAFEKGSRGYFSLEKEKPPLNLDKNSLLELAIFDKETAEIIMGIHRSQKRNPSEKNSVEND